jgi:hypothetical protein
MVVGSAAAGTDVVVLERAARLGAPAVVVLLGSEEDFERGSVADKGPEWVDRYRRLLRLGQVSTRTVPGAGNSGYGAVNAEIIDVAATNAERDEEVVVLVVRSPQSGPDFTKDLADRAGLRGWGIVEIPPEIT